MSRRHDPPERSTRAGPAAGLAAAGVCLVALAVYLRTLHTALPGPDSGELIAVARVSGVAHPPGYPLYTLLAHAFGAIAAAGRYAWRIHMLSALLNAAAAGILCAVVIRLTGRIAAGCTAGLALAFARPFWKAALVAEVFPLNSLMAALLWLAFAMLLRDAGLVGVARRAGHEPNARPWPLGLLLLITAAIPAHHHTLLLLALPLDAVAAALVLLPSVTLARILPGYHRPYALGARHVAVAAALLLLGLAPLAHLPLALARDAALTWGRPDTLAGFVELLTRAEYGVLDVAALPSSRIAAVNHTLVYAAALPRSFTWVGLLVAAVGALALAMGALRGRGASGAAGRPLLAALLGLAILQALFFSRIPLSVAVPYYRGVVERFYPLPDIAVALLVGLGAAALLARLAAPAARTAAGITLAAFLGGAPLVAHFTTLDQRGNTTIEDLGRNLLAALPRDAVLFASGDIVYNSLIELQVVEGVRPDVTLVEQYLLTRSWYVHAMRRRHPGLLPAFTTHAEPDSDRYRGDSLSGNLRWIEHLQGVRPVAFTGFIDPTFGMRYEMVRTGLVLVPVPAGAAPPPGERARTAVRLLETLALDSFFRRQDPLGPEAESRWRTTQFVSSVCFLLCEPDGQTITSAEFPGLRVLAGFLDRYESWTPSPDAELLRAAGFLHVYHPEFRSPARAARALEGYLASGATGAEADGAARLLDAIRSAR